MNYGIAALLLLFPGIALAQEGTFRDLVGELLKIGNGIIPIIIGLAVIVYLWNTFGYIRTEQVTTPDAKKVLMYGIVGILVMISFMGLLNILQSFFLRGGYGSTNLFAPYEPSSQDFTPGE